MASTALRGWQIGVETVYGTGVAATRKLYPGAGSSLEKSFAFHTPNLDIASYDEARAGRYRQLTEAGGSITGMPLDTNMIVELLRMSVDGEKAAGVQEGATTAYLWAFNPGATLKSATIEFDASGQIWEAPGCLVNELSISWSPSDPVTVGATLLAKDVVKSSLTGAIADFAMIPIQGWECSLFIDAAGGTAFTTAKAATLLGGEIKIMNNLQRRYTDDNTQALTSVTRGKRSLEATLTVDLGTNGMAQWDNWLAGTEVLVGLRFGNNVLAGTAINHKVDIAIPGVWTAQAIGDQNDGSTLELTLSNVYNVALARSFQVAVMNTRAT